MATQIKHGTLITPEALAVPKYKFAIMGALDSMAGIMQVCIGTLSRAPCASRA